MKHGVTRKEKHKNTKAYKKSVYKKPTVKILEILEKFLASNATVKPLLRLTCLASFSGNLGNSKASIEKTKNLMSTKLGYLRCLSCSLYYKVKTVFNLLFCIFD